MKNMVLALMWVFTAAVAAGAEAAPLDSDSIVAVVNDQVISSVDLSDRITLIMSMAGIPDTAETRARIAPQILRQLIDEKLELQDAAQASITIDDEKLRRGIAQVEAQSGKPPGSLEQFLQSKGLSKLSFYSQIRAQLAWAEIVRKKVRPNIRISDQEVARYVKRKAQAPAHADEDLIATIQLPVDAPKNEASIHKLADKLAGEIRTGASFDAVSSQFSSGTGGTKAAAPFWVELSQVDPAVAAALAKTAKGGITDPVRTAAGYQIIKLMDVRSTHAEAAPAAEVSRAELAYKQILMTLKPDAKKQEAELLLQLAKEVAKSPGRCNEKTMAGVGDLAAFDFTVSLERATTNDMPEKLRDLLMGLKVGGTSEPVVTPQGIRLFMLCERIDLPADKASTDAANEAIRQTIFREKLELEAQKYLRNLRREAFIELR